MRPPHGDRICALTFVFLAAAAGPATYTQENRDLADDDDDDDVPARGGGKKPADAGDEDTPHTLQLRILHALGSAPFTPRGEVTLNYNPSKRAGGKAITFSPGQKISRKDLSALFTSAGAAASSALYRVKFVPASATSDDEGVVASVPACALVASHMHETFLFHADPYGSLVGVASRTPITDCLSAGEQEKVLADTANDLLKTKGKVSFGRPGEKAKLHVRPGFDAGAQAAAQAVGSEAPPPAAAASVERNADGTPVPPPQSFWQKYWIYIVPLAIFMVIQAVMSPAEGPPAGAGRK
jgi:hypothetical protein